MSKSTRRIIKIIIQVLKFAASQFELFLKEDCENEIKKDYS